MAKTAWLLCLCMLLVPGPRAWAQTYALSADPSADVLTLTFPQKAPSPSTLRTGPRQVEMLFPAGTKLASVPAQVGRGRHVLGLGVADNVLVVQVAQESFGFIVSPKGANTLQLQVFYDPAGARWQPRGPAPADAGQDQAQQPAPAAQQPAAQPQAQTGATGQPTDQATPALSAPGASPPAAPAQNSRIVRHSVDLSAVPPADQAQATPTPPRVDGPQPAAQPQPPGSQSQGAAPVSGPARTLLAQTSGPTQGQAAAPGSEPAQATSGPGAIEQRLRQAAPTQRQGQAPQGQAPQAQPQPAAEQAAPAQANRTATPAAQTAQSPAAQDSPAAQTAPNAQSPAAPQAPGGANAPDSGKDAPDQGAQRSKAPTGVRGSVTEAAPPAQDTGQAAPAQAAAQTQGQTQGQPSAQPQAKQAGVRGQMPQQQAQTPSGPPPGQAAAGQAQGGQAAAGAKPASAPGGAQTPAPAGAPQDQPGAPVAEPSAPSPFSAQDGPSVDLTAPPKKSAPAQPKPEAFTLPAPGQEHPGTDTVEDKAFFVTGEQAASRGDFDKAESIFRTVLANPAVSPYMRENALYSLADLLFDKNREHITDAYQLIDNAYQEALNFNTTSRNIPKALVNLGYLNLRMGNLPEARAYFTLLKTKYPLDENVPLIDVYWGQHYLGQSKLGDQQGNLTRASQAFRSVLQNAPESKFAKDAALGLATTLLDLKQYDEAAKVLDYVDKRWPRYYVENPSLRRVTADVAYKLGNYEKAKDEYLWFMNLVPADETMDIVLARLGDVYARLDKRPVAREFYEMAVKRYPGKEGALMSLMRLAEQGVHDSPTTQEMFKAFASPKDVQPDEIYQMLVRDYPKSSVAPLALLKLSMWRLYQKQYPEALDSVLQFTNQYPGDELEKQAVEVGGQAFLKMLPTLMEDNNYNRVIDLWRKYPFLAKNLDFLPKRERLALALAQYYTGYPREALEAALPFLDQGPSEDSQKALALVLTIYRENQDWKAVLDTLRKVSGWKLKDNPRRILEFAQAMALEHTGDFAKSRLLWGRLAMDQQLDPAKRAYAMYYQARTAMERGDNEKAANWGMEARTLFAEAAKDTGKAQDALQLVIEAMQAGGRFQEALALCADYAKTVKEGSPEWAANRFRMAKLYGAMGDQSNWRKILEEMRDTLGDSLYAKMASSELATSALEERAGKLSSPK